MEKGLEKLQTMVIRDMKKAYPDVDIYDDGDLGQAVEDVYSSILGQVVLVIDEWDVVFRARQSDREGQTRYLDCCGQPFL